MRHLGYSAPEQLRCRLKGLSVPALVAEGTKLRPTRSPDPVTAATKASLSSLAHRISSLDDELAELDARIEALLVATVPALLERFGVGPDTAAALVMAGALTGFITGAVPGLQELGFGLALAVVLDATVVRCLFVPALVAAAGARSFAQPAALERRGVGLTSRS